MHVGRLSSWTNLFIHKLLLSLFEKAVLDLKHSPLDEVKVFPRELVELILHLPDVGFLQFVDRLRQWRDLVEGLPQV